MICYSYNKAINHHHHHCHHHRCHNLHHHRHHYHHLCHCRHHHCYHCYSGRLTAILIIIIIIIIIIINIIIRHKSFANNRKNRKKIQKNNVQTTIKKEHIKIYKENEVSIASNSTKTERNKKDHNRYNEVKSVAIIDNSMIKHLNGWDMSKKVHKSECKCETIVKMKIKPFYFTHWNE